MESGGTGTRRDQDEEQEAIGGELGGGENGTSEKEVGPSEEKDRKRKMGQQHNFRCHAHNNRQIYRKRS